MVFTRAVRFSASALALSCTFALASCKQEATLPASQGGPIELVVAGDPDSLDPRNVVDVVGVRASRLIHAGLTRPDPETQEPIPYLATSFRWIDDLTLLADLRRDLHWSNGSEFTSEDVVATFTALASPEVGARNARVVAPIASVVPDGKWRVAIHLKHPHAALLADLEMPILRRDQAYLKSDPAVVIDGLGPYAITRQRPGELLLAPRPSPLFLPSPAVVIRTIHDENARALRLLSGRTDVAQNVLSLSLLPAFAAPLVTQSHAGANTTYLVLRVDREPLADLATRLRIARSIDRDLITHTLMRDKAVPATTLIPKGHWAYSDPPTIQQAERTAGPGAPLSRPISILTSTERMRQLVGKSIAQELSDAGIETEARSLELGTMIQRLNTGDFDAAILQFFEFSDPRLLRFFLHSNAFPPAEYNRGRVTDTRLDELLDLGDRTLDRQARRAIYAQVEARVRESAVIIPLWHEENIAIVSKEGAAHFSPSADGRWLTFAKFAPLP